MFTKRAQAWGFDLVMGVTIFLAGIILFYIYTLNSSGGEEGVFQVLRREGGLVTDSLLSEGSPLNWDENNVVRIGLTTEDKINSTKLQMFDDMASADYDKTRNLFRIKDNYFVYLGEDEANGIGLAPTGQNTLVKVTRVCVYNGEITTLNAYIWN